MLDDGQLNRTFAALADPTRRAIIATISETHSQAEDGVAVSVLAEPFEMSLPAVLKHIKVLEDAGLVTRTKTGRTVHCALDAGPIQDALAWLEKTERFWSDRLDALARVVEKRSDVRRSSGKGKA